MNLQRGSGYLVEPIPQPDVVHRHSDNRLEIRLACLDQGPGRSGQGTGPIIAAWVTAFGPVNYFSGKARPVSIGDPYGPPVSHLVHKYLHNQSLDPNQGLDSADPDSYHCCCFHGFGGVEEEVVSEPHRPGSGPAMRSRSPEEEGADPGALPGGRGGDSGAGAATRNKGEPAYPMYDIGAGEGLRPLRTPDWGEFSPCPPITLAAPFSLSYDGGLDGPGSNTDGAAAPFRGSFRPQRRGLRPLRERCCG